MLSVQLQQGQPSELLDQNPVFLAGGHLKGNIYCVLAVGSLNCISCVPLCI